MSGFSGKPETITLYSTNGKESPLATVRVFGPARRAGLTVIQGVEGENIDPKQVSRGDIVLIQRDFPRHDKAYGEITSRARAEGLPLIFDLDDLLLELPEEHPDRISHYYSEALLPMLEAIIQADAVTASTQPLCDYLRSLNANVFLLPNYLDDDIWKLRQPRSPGKVTGPVAIAYMGGDSHTPDLASISSVLNKIARRYGSKVEFRFLGARPPNDLMDLPNLEWEPSSTFVYRQFAQDFLEKDYDICIAPLRDNLFNRCKSAIKFLEYTALGVPGVFSRIKPYADVVVHGKNGYLAYTPDEWEEYLCTLIESPGLRYETAVRAQEDVQANWMLSDHAHKWVEVYSQTTPQDITKNEALNIPPEIISSIVRQTQSYHRHLRSQQESLQTRLDQMAEQEHNQEKLTDRITQSSHRSGAIRGTLSRGLARVINLFTKPGVNG